MKQGRSLEELGRELVRQEGAKRDFLADANALRVETNGHTDLVLRENFHVNDVGHCQTPHDANLGMFLAQEVDVDPGVDNRGFWDLCGRAYAAKWLSFTGWVVQYRGWDLEGT